MGRLMVAMLQLGVGRPGGAAALATIRQVISKRDVLPVVANAMKGFDLDPFAWEDGAGSNMVVVMWRSAGGKHHLQTDNLWYLLGLIATQVLGKHKTPRRQIASSR